MSKEILDSVFGKVIISQIFSMSAAMLAPIIDGIITGRFIGVSGLAAASYASPVTMFLSAIGLLITVGAQIGCSQAVGKGDSRAASSFYSVGLFIIVVSALVATFIFVVIPDTLATLLGAQPGTEVHSMLSSYLVGFSIGFTFMQLSFFLAPVCQLSGASRIPVISGIILIVTDVALDIVNVVYADLGMFGMGAASAISYILSSLIAIVFVISKKCMFTFSVHHIKRKIFAFIMKMGFPAFVNQLGIAMMLVTLNYILTASGIPKAVSALCAAQSVFFILRSISMGIASSTLTLTGILASENDREGLSLLQKSYIKKSIIINFVIIVVVMLFSTPAIELFTTDVQVIVTGSFALRAFSLSLIFFSIDTCFRYYVQGLKRYSLSLVWAVLSSYLTVVLSAFAAYSFSLSSGIWFCFFMGETIMMIFIVVVAFASGNGTFSRGAFLLLPKDMKTCSTEYHTFCIHSVEEVMNASSDVMAICKGSGVDSKICNAVTLCMEEAGLNAVNHGFQGRKNVLDISLGMTDDRITIQFRDNGIPFSPTDFYKMHINDSPGENIGIHMIMGLACDVRYLQTLRLNCLFISFERKERR